MAFVAAPRRLLSVLGATTLLVALVAGCGDDSGTDTSSGDDTATTSGDAFCTARDDLGDALAAMVDPSDSTSVTEAYDQAVAAFDQLTDAAGDDLSDEVDALDAAVGSLDDAVTDSEGESAGARLETLGDSVSAVGTALDDLVSAAARDC